MVSSNELSAETIVRVESRLILEADGTMILTRKLDVRSRRIDGAGVSTRKVGWKKHLVVFEQTYVVTLIANLFAGQVPACHRPWCSRR